MLVTNLKLHDLLPLLAWEPVAAEIGVAGGDFSRKILDGCRPRRLHLIDPWAWQTGDYRYDTTNGPSQEVQDARFDGVLARFLPEIADGRVFIHRQYSWAAARDFKDDSLDWVFIDGDHTYNGCLGDLISYAPKIKSGGFIAGDDFSTLPGYREMKIDVVRAVLDFVRQGEWEILLLCSDWRYILARRGESERKQAVYFQAIQASDWITEIMNPEAFARVEGKGFEFGPGQSRTFYSFG